MELTGTEEEVQAQIEKRINELPQDVQNAILSSELGDKVLAIGSEAKLHLDQLQVLNDSTMFFMLGFTSEPEFQKEVQELAGGDATVAQKIVAQVNQQILLPIRESLKKTPVSPTPQSAPAQKPSLAEVLPKEGMRSVPLTTIPSTPTVAAPVAPAAPAPAAAPTTPVAASPIPPAVPAIPTIDMHPADIALTQKTVAMPAAPAAAPAATPAKPAEAKAVPPKPTDYKTDPYREPIS